MLSARAAESAGHAAELEIGAQLLVASVLALDEVVPVVGLDFAR